MSKTASLPCLVVDGSCRRGLGSAGRLGTLGLSFHVVFHLGLLYSIMVSGQHSKWAGPSGQDLSNTPADTSLAEESHGYKPKVNAGCFSRRRHSWQPLL